LALYLENCTLKYLKEKTSEDASEDAESKL